MKNNRTKKGAIRLNATHHNGFKARLIPRLTEIEQEHFWSHTNTSDPHACWEWNGWHADANRGHRYGLYQVQGECFGAHRVAYWLFYAVQPADKVVMHRCDNCNCVNPRHLQLGTQLDNIADRVFKSHRKDAEIQKAVRVLAGLLRVA